MIKRRRFALNDVGKQKFEQCASYLKMLLLCASASVVWRSEEGSRRLYLLMDGLLSVSYIGLDKEATYVGFPFDI